MELPEGQASESSRVSAGGSRHGRGGRGDWERELCKGRHVHLTDRWTVQGIMVREAAGVRPTGEQQGMASGHGKWCDFSDCTGLCSVQQLDHPFHLTGWSTV